MMSWVVTVIVGLLAGIGAGAAMLGISTVWVRWFRISSFEGGSGYFVVFNALVGLVVGGVAAAVAARLGHAYWSPAWYAQFLCGFGVVAALLGIVFGISYLKVDHTPEDGGRGLVVALEVRLPKAEEAGEFGARGNPAEWPEEELKVQLVSLVREKHNGYENAKLDRATFRQDGGQWIVPARIPLWTSRGEFCVNLTLGGRDDGFWPPFKPVPVEGYFQWSEWIRTNKGREKASDSAAVMYRFRFERGEPIGKN